MGFGHEEYVGYAGSGIFTQTGGTNYIPSLRGFEPAMLVGVTSTSSGTYNLSGTGSLIIGTDLGQLDVGVSGMGTFNQSGGLVKIGGTSQGANVAVGYNAQSIGIYNLSGGSLSIATQGAAFIDSGAYVVIGLAGSGTFNQTGGSVVIADQGTSAHCRLDIGSTAEALGTYLLNGVGTLTVNGTETIGRSATGMGILTSHGPSFQDGGRFIQSGGTHTVSGNLELASVTNSTASYILSDGSVSVGSATGDYSEVIGNSGRGTFNQSGGANSISNSSASLELGVTSVGSGTYNLSGGTLSVGNTGFGQILVGVDGSGVFNQSGGTAVVGSTTGVLELSDANFGKSGTYSLSGGTLAVGTSGTGQEYIAYGGQGTFVQTGGSHIIGSSASSTGFLRVGVSNIGAYTLNGGSASLFVNGRIDVGPTSGVLNVMAGSATSTGTVKVYDTANTALSLSGGTLTASALDLSGNVTRFKWTGGKLALTGGTSSVGTLAVPTAGTLAGTGTITGNVSTAGNISPGNAVGTLAVAGNLTMQSGATFAFDLGPSGDLIAVTGLLTDSQGPLPSAYQVSFGVTTGLVAGQTYTLFTFANTTGANALTAGDLVDVTPYIQGVFNYNATSVTFTTLVVPDPSSPLSFPSPGRSG